MSEFWKNIKNIFKSAEDSTSNQPVIHELIERSPDYKIGFERWQEGLVKERLLNWLKEEHIKYLQDPKSTDAAIDFLNTPSTKGFVIHFYKTRYSNQEVVYLFDYLKECVLKLHYKSYVSDTRSYNKKDWVERLDRHYLKPPTNLRNPGKEQFNQRFGNITIELLFRNDKIYLLKFSATTYSDHLYKEADEFNELMKHLYFKN